MTFCKVEELIYTTTYHNDLVAGAKLTIYDERKALF